jgi:hypothetical protein
MDTVNAPHCLSTKVVTKRVVLSKARHLNTHHRLMEQKDMLNTISAFCKTIYKIMIRCLPCWGMINGSGHEAGLNAPRAALE